MVKALSENVVAMATREGLSFQFCFQNITYIFLGKSQGFKKKVSVVLELCFKNLKGGGEGGGAGLIIHCAIGFCFAWPKRLVIG